jgi:N-acetylmuramoyl-L-alanine amidase CwlA
MTIHKNLTTRNFTDKNDSSRIEYIVIHYTGNDGDTAYNNTKYFKTEYRGASAHYFVDETSIWQCVLDEDIAWHCGATRYKHPYCRNENSIGIEMCCRKNISNGTWYFEEETIKTTIELVKELMAKYNIPASNVIRHYDVTGKTCPEPYVRDTGAWNTFKASLTAKTISTSGYLVKITADTLNVRQGAGTGYKITTTVKKNEVYTIVDEYNGWGKLKSGAGWISLAYTKRV